MGSGSAREGLRGLTDEDCAVLARSGSRPAQEELVSRYLPGVFDLLARCLDDRAGAADASQEVFLRVFREIRSYDAARRFRPWIYAIAWNLARDLIRRRAARRKETGRLVSLEALSGDKGRIPEPVDPRGREPLDVIEAREQAAIVRSALRRIDPGRRALLILREYEGLSYEEIAEALGSRVGTVKSGIHRARLELKEALLRLQPDWIVP
jgi:RNA polymerase sigma-70 factor (ECF subfamily)